METKNQKNENSEDNYIYNYEIDDLFQIEPVKNNIHEISTNLKCEQKPFFNETVKNQRKEIEKIKNNGENYENLFLINKDN